MVEKHCNRGFSRQELIIKSGLPLPSPEFISRFLRSPFPYLALVLFMNVRNQEYGRGNRINLQSAFSILSDKLLLIILSEIFLVLGRWPDCWIEGSVRGFGFHSV